MSKLESDGETARIPMASGKWPASKVALVLLSVIAIVLVGWALRAAGVVVVPLVFSFLIALVVAPVDRVVSAIMPHRLKWIGHVAAMGVIMMVLASFAGGMWIAADRIVAQLPRISQQLQSMADMGGSGNVASDETQAGIHQDGDPAAGVDDSADESPRFDLSELTSRFRGASGQLGSRLADWAIGYAASILGSAGSAMGSMVLIFFFVLLMLVEAPAWRTKMSRIFAPDQKDGLIDSFSVIARQLRRYLLLRVILGLVTGALYAAWLWWFDMDLLIVWALLAFLLNFVPTLGSLVAGALPIVYALVQKDLSTALIVGGGILAIEQIMGNYVDPRVQGRQLSLSPLMVLVVILVWGWLWGVAGALLAVPVTMSLVVIFAHVPRLRPIALFLSDESDYRGLDRMASRR